MFDIVVKNEKGEKVASHRCLEDSCGIGKARHNLVQVRGWRVGGVHAILEQNSDGIFVEHKDGGATVVNGEKIKRYGPLRSHDVIEIGGFKISVGLKNKQPEEVTSSGSGATIIPALPTESGDEFKTMLGVRQHAGVKSDETIFKEERYRWRNQIHEELLRMMDLRRTDVGAMDEASLRKYVKGLVDEIIEGLEQKLPKTLDRQRLAQEVLNEAVGLGPLEELIAQTDITEIMVNRYDDIYIERKGRLEKSKITFSSDNAVMSAIERIVSPLGRRIDESSPMVDGRLQDGSRVNCIIPPLALKGPCITIRKFSTKKLTDEDLIGYGSVNQNMVEFLKVAVDQAQNIIISGGTGSGKTTLLNILSNFIPADERIITVEDAAELRLGQPHIVSLEARPPNLEGKGAVTIRDLVKNCLRMRPDRIVVGECRGGEALDMLQAMNTGHDGSLTTAHANSPRDVISRLEVMVMMSGMELPVLAIREQISSAVDIIVQQSRMSDGTRKVTHINEVTGVESGVIQMQEIFRYKQEGFDEEGKVRGHFEATGRIPHFYEDLRQRGISVNMGIFQ